MIKVVEETDRDPHLYASPRVFFFWHVLEWGVGDGVSVGTGEPDNNIAVFFSINILIQFPKYSSFPSKHGRGCNCKG